MTARQLRIVSGGQTGVDRAALDAALEAGTPCGGWCPAGRIAEDGAIDEAYPLRESTSSDVADRTCRNVDESDGTVVFQFDTDSPGTRLTIEHAVATAKPLLLLDLAKTTPDLAVDRIKGFVESCQLETINVAGPRASEAPEAYHDVRRIIATFLQMI